MVLQAFIDDSYTSGGTFVLGGHIASADSWAAFSKEWQELLPYGVRDKDGKFHFKMSEMALSDERMERVQAFFRIIERHVLCALASAYNVAELERAKQRVKVPGVSIDWGFLNNRYLFAFRSLMDMFHTYRERAAIVIPLDQKVDFYFDEQAEKKVVLSEWDSYMRQRPSSTRDSYGATPIFGNDKELLPLQASDFWAWWVRKWVEEGRPDKMEECDFGEWKAIRKYPRMFISLSEDQIVEFIVGYLRDNLGPERPIYDLKQASP